MFISDGCLLAQWIVEWLVYIEKWGKVNLPSLTSPLNSFILWNQLVFRHKVWCIDRPFAWPGTDGFYMTTTSLHHLLNKTNFYAITALVNHEEQTWRPYVSFNILRKASILSRYTMMLIAIQIWINWIYQLLLNGS